MIKELEKKYHKIVKQAVAPLGDHHAGIDTMVLKIGQNFFGYQPFGEHKQKRNQKMTPARNCEIMAEFKRIATELLQNDIEILFCLMYLEEGGGIIYMPQDSLKYRMDVMETLKSMETKH